MLNSLKNIAIADFDYPLPDDRIARYPLAQRDLSKLLLLNGDQLSQHTFLQLPSLLPPDAMLVFNNTKVIHARLLFKKTTGSTIEIFCLEPWQMAVSQAFEQRHKSTWLCFIGNNKKWKTNPLQMSFSHQGTPYQLTATRRQAQGNAWIVDFNWTGEMDFATVIEQAGVIPLPPYLGREAEADDATRYQTIYAQHDGSVAAPTAGLHFTNHILQQLHNQSIPTEYITLHVGAGTFKPISSTTIGQHEMHTEQVQASTQNLQHLIDYHGQHLIAVGTTTVRTLESLYWFGVKLSANPNLHNMEINQWDPYTLQSQLSRKQSFSIVLDWMHQHRIEHLHGTTRLMIAPGYQYRVINGLITNFHQPKSTLLLLVSALIGDRWRECYHYALQHQFRFLSYGDSCLFLP